LQDFTAGLFPFRKNPSHNKVPFSTNGSAPPSPPYVIDLPVETTEELSQQFQDFYVVLEEDLRLAEAPLTSRPKSESLLAGLEKPVEDAVPMSAGDARDIMEAVERVICSLFYDRYFLLSTLGSNIWLT